MAKDKLTEYDATANNNTVVGDVNLAENSALPSDMNNAVREIMSHQKEAFGAGTPLYVDQANNRVGVNKTPTVALDVSGALSVTGDITASSFNGGQLGGRRNLIINGAMKVAQRATSVAGIGATSGYYTIDRYQIISGATAGRFTMAQVADVHDGFANAMKLTCTTADASISAGEYMGIHYRIEGQDLQQIKKGTSDAEKVTISFYVKGNASATYMLEVKDSDNTRLNQNQFAVTTDWTRIEITLNADTTGAFTDDNGLSLELSFWLHGGSTYTSGTYTANTWAGQTNANRLVGISSFFDSTDRTFFITGLQMEVGSVATPFEHRSFGEELALCQRYYYHTYSYGTPAGTTFNQDYESPIIIIGTGNHGMGVCNGVYPVEMRVAPTLSFYSSDGTANKIRHWGGAHASYGTVNRSTRQILGMSFNAGTNPEDFYSAALVCDAEL